MLDSKVAELTDGLIQTQFTERRQLLQEEFLRVAQELTGRGNLHTSAHVLRVAEVCRREMEIRAWIVHNVHLRVLSQLGVDPYPELSGDLKNRLSFFVSLGDDYARAPNELAQRLGLQSHPDYRMHETREHILAKLGTEIDLFVEGLVRCMQQHGATAEGSSTFHFHSAVGAVQTGHGSTANVVQHIGTQERETLLQALAVVKDALSKLPDTAGASKAEIVEMVEDAHAEIQKPAPNRIKMASILTTIGDTIRVLGSMNSAYQSLKIALLPYGLTLP